MQDYSELVEKIKKANRDYYLEGSSELSDAEYDALVADLRKVDPKNPILAKVGDDSESTNKVKLPNTMGSLNKTRPDDGEIKKLYPNRMLVLMPKLDGISMQVEYEDGKFNKLYTRGNGYIGQDITARAKYMNFPKELAVYNPGKTYILGEAIVSRENFKKAKGEYKHPRNFVGGTLRPILTNAEYEELDNDIKFNCSLIDIVAFGAINLPDTSESFKEDMNFVENVLKFKTVEHLKIHSSKINPDFLHERIRTYKETYDYLTDGIVLRLDDKNYFNTLGMESNGLNPRGARAVKANLEQQFSQPCIITDIQWNISKRGIFVPLAIIEAENEV